MPKAKPRYLHGYQVASNSNSSSSTSTSTDERNAIERQILKAQERAPKRRRHSSRAEIPSDFVQPGTFLQISDIVSRKGESFKGGIAGVNGPDEFWVTFNKDLSRRKMLIKRMTKFYATLTEENILPRTIAALVTPGLLVAVNSRQQNTWSRARIIKQNSPRVYTVDFVDKVGKARIASRDVRFLSKQFLDPPCITECQLSVERVRKYVGDHEMEFGAEWSTGVNALEQFHNLVREDVMVSVKIMEYSPEQGPQTVELKRYTRQGVLRVDWRYVNVAEEMLRAVYQIPMKELYVPINSDNEDSDSDQDQETAIAAEVKM